MKPQFLFVSAALVSSSFAVTYLNVEQAQQALFPGRSFTRFPVSLSEAQKKAIEAQSHVRLTGRPLQVWRVASGGWFIVDEVIGKHDFITYAVGLTSKGVVTGIEIMDYRESYGGQVRDPQWRAQFSGKTSAAPLQLDHDIKNISGATLSSRHVTEGVRRLLAFYDAVLR